MPVLTVGDRSEFRSYGAGNLYCHVLAFRVTTSRSIADLLVTDYTANDDIQAERLRPPTFEGLQLQHNQVLQLTISIELLEALAQDYQSRFDEEFFDRLGAHLSQTSWVVLHDRLCLANLQIRLQKKATHLMGHVKQLWVLLYQAPDALPFWERVLAWCGQIMTRNPGLAAKVVGILSKECQDRAATVLGTLAVMSDSTSYSTGESQTQVKAEHSSDEIDLQNHLRDMLEPVSQPAQPHRHSQTQTQYLTQLQSLNSQPESQINHGEPRNGLDAALHQRDNYPSRDDDNLFAHEALANPFHSLAQLNRLPLVPNNRIYKTEAYVVGVIPQDLTSLCTKVYEVQDSQISLSDPHIEPLELILLDLDDKLLTPENSLLVWVSRADLMHFMGLNYPEQLYTRLGHFQALFKKRLLRKIPLELTISTERAISKWTTRNLDFGALVQST